MNFDVAVASIGGGGSMNDRGPSQNRSARERSASARAGGGVAGAKRREGGEKPRRRVATSECRRSCHRRERPTEAYDRTPQEGSDRGRREMRCYEVAERGGFEPPAQVTPGNCLAGSPVQPLQHLSARWRGGFRQKAARAGLSSTGGTRPPARDRRFYSQLPTESKRAPTRATSPPDPLPIRPSLPRRPIRTPSAFALHNRQAPDEPIHEEMHR